MKKYFRHLSVVCILATVISMTFAGCGSSSNETTVAETAVETETNIELTEEAQDSQISTLMNTYFTALQNGNVTALAEIMVNAPTQETVDSEIEYVQDYENIKCYTSPGVEDQTWVAYVYYDVKFKNIETSAPSMIREYICTNNDGNLYLNNGTVDTEVSEWLDTVNSSDAVTNLLAEVNTELTQAASSDEDLATLVSALGVETETAAETTAAETTAAETTAAETTAAETTAAETTAAETTAAETTAAETTKETAAAETSKAEETKKASSTDYKKFSKKKTMYTIDITNVRKKASKNSKLLGRLDENKKVTALGTKNGFTAIKYGSKIGYIKSDLLTTKKPKTTMTFKAKNDKVEAKMNVKLRKKPSTSAKSKGILVGGTVVKRTGYNKKWTRIKYKGKTYYVATKYVAKKK